MLLEDKVAIVSGSSKGIGAAIAYGLAQAGASVVINYRKSTEAAEEVVARCKEADGDAIAVAADVTTSEGVEKLVNETLFEFGKIDILVNNVFAPFKLDAEHRKYAWEMEWEDYTFQLNGGLKPAHMLTQAVLPTMRKFNSGSIVNMTTNLIANPVVPYQGYITAKAAVMGYTRSMAVDLGSIGIRMNAVAPGIVYPTQATVDTTKEALKEQISEQTPLGRIARPEDIAGSVVFFASDKLSGFVTGQMLHVDGGLVMR